MRDEDIRRLSEPYEHTRVDVDRRFHSAIGADIPHAGILVREILADLDRATVGVSWWGSTAVHERALIGGYLYQCAFGLILPKQNCITWSFSIREKSMG